MSEPGQASGVMVSQVVFAGDSGPGQAKGQGIKSFGGTWYVVNASGNPVKSTSGGSSGGGY